MLFEKCLNCMDSVVQGLIQDVRYYMYYGSCKHVLVKLLNKYQLSHYVSLAYDFQFAF